MHTEHMYVWKHVFAESSKMMEKQMGFVTVGRVGVFEVMQAVGLTGT